MDNETKTLRILNTFKNDSDIDDLSGILMTYATNNFINTYKDQEHTKGFMSRIHCEELVSTDESPIDNTEQFISVKDMMEYYLREIASIYKDVQLKHSLELNNIQRIIYLDDEVIGYLIGNARNGIFDIRYIVLFPEYQGRQIMQQMYSICITELSKTHNIDTVRIDIKQPYADLAKARKFMKEIGANEKQPYVYYARV